MYDLFILALFAKAQLVLILGQLYGPIIKTNSKF